MLAAAAATASALVAFAVVATDRIGFLTGLALATAGLTVGAFLWAAGRICADVAAARRAVERGRDAAEGRTTT